jgi:ketosteroid isomerase-like protein
MGDEKQAVMEALGELGAAFVSRDLAAFERVCTPDPVFIGSTEGEEAVGRGEAITAMWDAIASRAQGVSFKLEWESVEVEVVGDLALMVGFGTATFGTPFRTVTNRYRVTGVLKRSGERWLWRMHHGSEPLPW